MHVKDVMGAVLLAAAAVLATWTAAPIAEAQSGSNETKSCDPYPTAVGDPVDCLVDDDPADGFADDDTGMTFQFNDSVPWILLEAARDVVDVQGNDPDAGDLPATVDGDLGDNCPVDLADKITRINGNASCQLAGGDPGEECNRNNPASCVLPCIVCSELAPGATQDATTGINCSGPFPEDVPVVGEIVFGHDEQCPLEACPESEVKLCGPGPDGVLIEANINLGCSSDDDCQGDDTCLNTFQDRYAAQGRNTNNVDRGGNEGARTTCDVDTPPSNDFKCYQVKPEPGQRFPTTTVATTDQFGSRTSRIARPSQLCTPVDKRGEGIANPDAHLTCYKLATSQRDPWRVLEDQDQFGSEDLFVARGAELCLPALKNCVPGEEEECDPRSLEETLSHFQCYQARSRSETPIVPGELDLSDQFGSTVSAVGGVIRHCNPLTSKQIGDGSVEELTPVLFPPPSGGEFWEEGDEVHHKCYALEDETRPRLRSVEIRDQLFPDGYDVRVGRATQLCEPADKVEEPEEPPVNGD